ncbi:MAG: thioredoxin domain-containing protein [bacterium]|nr:MAG: thioredoxin domain-containing protein [bacterium]KAF0149299.1 MAG: thioredoxin domain-containing protein [bacterium]KAF0169821.1 MAG: thioredoxin domain-containing protein [bacterium]TXT22745.1 MAG: thioredoxin domain-containing protein [bacterium]
MPNRLARETSPYLLQHADQPVDWQPWGPQALEQAKREDKPILLSVGYSTCHWCHVMARESFEDPGVAVEMNAHFVCVKVDREERPDLDQIYQAAQQMLSGRPGGWPLTLFLMPDGTPFFGGTYFPREPRHNLPGLIQVLAAVRQAYRQRRADLEEQNTALLRAFATEAPAAQDGAIGPAPIRQAVADLRSGFDPVHGGYGGAPKFPRPAELEFLFWSGDAEARAQALFTLEKMAAGGLMDQLGGGFFRYSTDVRWAIPHFEKMLYDNGPLLSLYADAWAATGRPLLRRAAEGIVTWLAREMTTPEGLFQAALDAESQHEEGRFYVWTPAQAEAVLSPEEFAVACPHWGLDGAPNFEARAWHLVVARPLDEVAGLLGIAPEQAEARLQRARARLFAARETRVRPGRDDKVLTAWNALMIRGLAHAARRFDRPDWLAMARRAGDALRRLVWAEGRLAATFQGGQARHNGYLDDHAFLLDALLELAQADWRDADLAWARELADTLLAWFEDERAGGFYFTSHDHERLIHRPMPIHDQATPAGNGIAALALGRLGLLLEEPRYRRAAERALARFQASLAATPAACPSLLTALGDCLSTPRLIVLTGPEPELSVWKQAADRAAGLRDLLFKRTGDAREIPTSLRKPVGNTVNAHVCAGVNCLPEIVQIDALMAIFSNQAVQ